MQYDRARKRTRAHKYPTAAEVAGLSQAAASTVVVVLQSLFCLLLLVSVFTLRFISAENYAVLGDYYKAVMNETNGEAVEVGAFGKPLTLSDIEDYVSAARWSQSVAVDGGGMGAATLRGDLYFGPLAFTGKAEPPLSGTVTSLFALRENPFTGETEFHNGLDIAAPEGTNIYAVLPGEVCETGWSDSYGNYIKLRHADGFETWYNHCSVVLAQEGAQVRAGERIAEAGSTGNSTGSHLHLTLWVDGKYADPLKLYLC